MGSQTNKKITTKDEAYKVIRETIDAQDIDVITLANNLFDDICICLATAKITVTNLDVDGVALVKVSKTCNGGGSDDYFELEEGQSDTWTKRCVGHKVKITQKDGPSIKITVDQPSFNQYVLFQGEIQEKV